MKTKGTTGMVRKVDNLGRIVLPREIRKQFQIKDGDSFEFFVDQDKIVLKKYLPLQDKFKDLYYMCLLLEEKLQCRVYFFVGDEVIDVKHQQSQIQKKELSENFMQEVQSYYAKKFKNLPIYKEDQELYSGFVRPVIIDGGFYGSFVIVKMGEPLTETEENSIKVVIELIKVQYEI